MPFILASYFHIAKFHNLEKMRIVCMISTKYVAFISHVLQLGVVMAYGPNALFISQLSPNHP